MFAPVILKLSADRASCSPCCCRCCSRAPARECCRRTAWWAPPSRGVGRRPVGSSTRDAMLDRGSAERQRGRPARRRPARLWDVAVDQVTVDDRGGRHRRTASWGNDVTELIGNVVVFVTERARRRPPTRAQRPVARRMPAPASRSRARVLRLTEAGGELRYTTEPVDELMSRGTATPHRRRDDHRDTADGNDQLLVLEHGALPSRPPQKVVCPFRPPWATGGTLGRTGGRITRGGGVRPRTLPRDRLTAT